MPFLSKKEKARREKVSKAMKEKWSATRVRKAIREELAPVIVEAGRRVVDLQLFAKQMWCEDCDSALSLRFLEEERKFGLASKFTVRCHQCLLRKEVFTSALAPSEDGRPLYAVNCKAAVACLDTGVGHDQFNKLFSAMNLPTILAKTMTKAEKRVGPSVVEVAEQSCRDAIAEEKDLTLSSKRVISSSSSHLNSSTPITNGQVVASTPLSPLRDNSSHHPATTPRGRHSEEAMDLDITPEDPVEIVAKYDFGWDKRGNGYQYNSHSGRGSLFGNLTNKIMGYATLSNYCAMCVRGHSPDDHECAKNYDGSSKGMESAAAVQLILHNSSLDAAGVRVKKLIGDRDSSTIAALRRESPHEIEKLVDLNHNLKSGVNNPLYDLKKNKGHSKILTKEVIEYIKRCVSYAIKQNKDNVEGVRSALLNISDHIYGEHNACGSWCKAKGNPEYFYKYLPKGKPLSCPAFRTALIGILKSQADDAEKLAPCGSSLVNESFNHMCNTRAPKSRFYCGTNANLHRVSSAVCCKNIGADCIENIFKQAKLSPSCSDFRKKLQKVRVQQAIHKNKPGVKLRRLFLKNKNCWKDAADNNRDGLTYVSGMSNTMERAAVAASIQSWLPPAQPLRPSCKLVIVDIETSGLAASASIIQIAAKCGDKTFSANIVPLSRIDPKASAVTGFTVSAGKLWRHGQLLPTVSEEEASRSFVNFLKSCADQVALVGHNIVRFDAPRILRLLNNHALSKEFCEIVFGVVDTMPLIKQGKMQKQDLLASTFLTGPEWEPYVRGAHDALSDCILLDGLLQHFNISEENQKGSIYPLIDFMARLAALKKKKDNSPALAPLRDHGVSQHMVGKMAESGVTVEELKKEYDTHGRRGLEVCLGVQLKGKPRVTTSAKIVDAVEAYFKSNA